MLKDYPKPPFPNQPQTGNPGKSGPMDPQPDHGEESYKGSGRLEGKKARDHGRRQRDRPGGRDRVRARGRGRADRATRRGRGRAARPRAGSRQPGRKAVLLPGDIAERAHCRGAGRARRSTDVRPHRHPRQQRRLPDEPTRRWRRSATRSGSHTFDTNITRDVPYRQGGAAAHAAGRVDHQHRLGQRRHAEARRCCAYATTKGAIQNFTGGLAQLLAEKGIRANCVAPGPIWTPLIPSTMPPEQVESFGSAGADEAPGPAGRAGAAPT